MIYFRISAQCGQKARGVGIVEVLVALVILSVGLLGTATLYVTSLQAKTTAQSRMQAVNLAADIADRIRANRDAGDDYEIATTDTAATPSVNCIQTSTTPAVNCTPTQLAVADLFQWSDAVDTTLPGNSTRSIVVTDATATTPTIYDIALTWEEPSAGTLTYTVRVEI